MEVIHNEDCYVAFLDMLGFSNAVISESPKLIEEIFDTIKNCKKEILNDKCAWDNESDNLANNTVIYIMSDSIVLAIKSSIGGAIDFLIRWCKEIQFRLLSRHKILVRGGISQGLHYQDNEIAFGVGFVKAHMIECVAKTPRIVIDDAIDIPLGCNVSEDIDKKKYIDFLGDCYWDDEKTRYWMSFANSNIKKNEGLIEKYKWLSNQFASCNDRYEMKISEEEYSKNNLGL
ncbi:MAG: hypothetical protein K6F92_06170 [Lachnospiraceae bacterium]|nr:hypothetical protein [Lachnospiraceae bacterium]